MASSLSIEPGILIAYLGLGILAIIPIILGSLASLKESHASASGSGKAEKMAANDAYLFPLIGSVILFSFYLLFKYLNPEYINLLLTAYFSFFGIYALSGLLEQLVELVVPSLIHKGQFWMKIGGTSAKPKWSVEVTIVKIVSWAASIALTVYYVFSKNWIASNLLGVAFATSAISLIHLDSFKTGAILLAGLFLYDVFWVFGTDVMVKVAKSFDVPVKLLFPKNGNFINARSNEFALLGLGDIVIPGVWVALCHRFDHALPKSHAKKLSFFAFALAFYIAGLATTMVVMHVFKAAQPALLYLSPACILSVLLCAVINGNLSAVLSYEDGQPLSKKSKSPAKKSKHVDSPVIEIAQTPTADSPRRTSRRHSKSD